MDVAIKFLIQKKKITVILSEANPISKFKTPVSNGRSLCLDTKVTPHASTLVIWNAKVKVKNRLSMSRPKHEYKRGKSLKFWWHETGRTKLGVHRWTYKISYIRTSEIISINEKKRTTYLVEGSPPADPPRKQDKKEKTIWNSSWLIQPSSQNAVWLNEIFTFTQQFIEEDHTIFINISLKSEYWAWEKTTRRLQWNDNDLRLYFFVLRNFENFWLFLWMVLSFIALHQY